MNQQNSNYDPTDEKRSAFDWIIFLLIHAALIGGIITIAFYVYSPGLATWVSVSAFIAGIVCMYLYAKLVPGETLMKVVLYTVAAANAGYLAYNGAQEMGVGLFNQAQTAKYGEAVKAAASSRRAGVRKDIMSQAGKDTLLEKAFGNSTSVIAGALACLELATALIVFAMASRRVAKVKMEYAATTGTTPPPQSASGSPAGFASPAPVVAAAAAQSPRPQAGFAPPGGIRQRRSYVPSSTPPPPPNSTTNRP